MSDPTDVLRSLFTEAVHAVSADSAITPNLPDRPKGRTVVLGAGKAAAAMARAVEEHWDGDLSGLVVTRYGHGVPCERIEVIEAAHPVPDESATDAARRMLAMAHDLGPDDLALCLLSGGGSSVLTLPAEGITLEDKQIVTSALLRSGATIHEMNCVRKHLSAIKGGRLGAACSPARVHTIVISDVVRDDPSVIASGPTSADPTTLEEARSVIARYSLNLPPRVADFLANTTDETIKPGDPRLAGVNTIVAATASDALAAAADAARRHGLDTFILGDAIEGEARFVAADHARAARAALELGMPARPPCVLLSGGETTVTVSGRGRGGRNAEYLLALGLALNGHAHVHALACDTDGIDGTEDNAGCVLCPDTLARARSAGLDPGALLDGNDAYRLFAALDDLVVTGPTRTNVNDFRAILVTN